MVEYLRLRDLLSFESVELEFSQGLVVFTGPSGAGKTVLLSSLLNLLGLHASAKAQMSEISLRKPQALQSESLVLEEDTIVVRSVYKEKQRFFIDGQGVSKKELSRLLSPYVTYLSVREKNALGSDEIIKLIDRRIASKDAKYHALLQTYQERYRNYLQLGKELFEIEQKGSDRAERIEFLRYEIEKINRIDPKVGELERLLEQKQLLSSLEKIKDLANKAREILHYEEYVNAFYAQTRKENSSLSEGLMQLGIDIQEALDQSEELESLDVESLLDRIGELNDLLRRYGSIEEAIKSKESKEKELALLEGKSVDVDMLRRKHDDLSKELLQIAKELSLGRKKEAKAAQKEANRYLKVLKLPDLEFAFEMLDSPNELGYDVIRPTLSDLSDTKHLSGGEFNRLRLVIAALDTSCEVDSIKKVMVLDEIDANVSGDESIAIANLIKQLSKHYQLFAISHQPHLSAIADQHILVQKVKDKSRAIVLDEEARIREIARIMEGEHPTSEALEFARKLRT